MIIFPVHFAKVTTLFVLGLLSLALLGCAGGTSVSGTVTLDNQPVENGTITFIPTSEGIKVGTLIENGNYEIPPEKQLTPGQYKVEIHWPKKTGKKIPSGDPYYTKEEDETKEAIPAQYNTQSTLTAELKSGQNEHNFKLESK